MAEIINLRMARKAKARQEAQVRATANRALHGRTKAEKQRQSAEKGRIGHMLDQARRDPPED